MEFWICVQIFTCNADFQIGETIFKKRHLFEYLKRCIPNTYWIYLVLKPIELNNFPVVMLWSVVLGWLFKTGLGGFRELQSLAPVALQVTA